MQGHGYQGENLSISTGFVEVDGGQIYYEVAGKGHPLVLLQGRGLVDRRIWDEQFTTFAHYYRVVRYDERGYGKSPGSTCSYTQADDLDHVLHVLQMERGYLLDLGGSIALNFIHEHPSFADALIIASPGTSPAPSITEAMAELPAILERYTPVIEALQRNDIPHAVYEAMQKLMFLSPSSISLESYQQVQNIVAENIQAVLKPSPPPKVDIDAFNSRGQWLREIQIPTLLLVGENAIQYIQSSAIALEKNIPGIHIHKIAHASFLLNIEQPADFNRIVLSFLQALL